MELYNASNGPETEEELLTLEEYEERKTDLEKIIEVGKAAKRLASQDDFELLVMKGYFEEEPQRLAALMASGRLNETSMKSCMKELEAIGSFRAYMQRFIEQLHLAEDELESLDLAREESILREAGEIQ